MSVFNINGLPSDLLDSDIEHQRSIKVTMTGTNGEPIASLGGAMNVHLADVHSFPVNEYFHRHTGINDTFAIASLKGDTSITVTNGSQFSAGNYLHIRDTTIESTFPEIKSISGNTLNLDRPLDNAYSVGDSVESVSFDMNVSGTLSNPISFKLSPITGENWHIVRLIFTMTHDAEGNLGLFGDINELANGVVLRTYKASTNQYTTFTVWKTNSDIKDDFYNLEFDLRTATYFGSGGTNGTTGNGEIRAGTGAVSKLDGTDGDYMEILIQDDLSGLVSYRLKGQGHIEGV